jgi:hypothetical protein
MCVVAEPRAVDVNLSHQFEEEIGAASSENGPFIAKTEFSVQTTLAQHCGSIQFSVWTILPDFLILFPGSDACK